MADAQALYTLLKEIYLMLDDGDRLLLGQFDLTPSRYYALIHLGEQPGLSLSQLSQLIPCDKSNATRIVRGLENDGLVCRRPHERDRRAIRLYLSEKGETLRHRATAAHKRYNELRLKSVSNANGESLLVDLDLLKRKLGERGLTISDD